MDMFCVDVAMIEVAGNDAGLEDVIGLCVSRNLDRAGNDEETAPLSRSRLDQCGNVWHQLVVEGEVAGFRFSVRCAGFVQHPDGDVTFTVAQHHRNI